MGIEETVAFTQMNTAQFMRVLREVAADEARGDTDIPVDDLLNECLRRLDQVDELEAELRDTKAEAKDWKQTADEYRLLTEELQEERGWGTIKDTNGWYSTTGTNLRSTTTNTTTNY